VVRLPLPSDSKGSFSGLDRILVKSGYRAERYGNKSRFPNEAPPQTRAGARDLSSSETEALVNSLLAQPLVLKRTPRMGMSPYVHYFAQPA
jgi:hypothetical protein